MSQVTAEGPTAGPAGLIIPFVTPPCTTTDGDQGILVLYVDYEEIAFIWGFGVSEPVQWSYWTINDDDSLHENNDNGTHQFSVACYDSGSQNPQNLIAFVAPWEGTLDEWKDNGFSYQVTAPSIPTELSSQHAGPGSILTTSSGAPAGPTPCPTVDTKPWQTVRIAFYSWSKEEWLQPEDRYPLQNPDVADLPLLPLEIPPSAKQGERLGVTVECNRPAENREAEEVGFTFGTAPMDLDEPAGGSLRQRELAAGGWNSAEWCLNCFLRKYVSFGDPVDAPTGNFWHSVTDFNIPGRGMGLDLARTYNSMSADTDGPFGYGWSFSYGMSLAFSNSTEVLVNQENDAQVAFTKQPDGTYTAPPRVTASLAHNTNGTWTFTRRAREVFTFDSNGRLLKESDLNGNVTTLTYNGDGELDSVTDPAGRSLAFAYSGGHIVAVTDPLGLTGPRFSVHPQ